ncbi:carbohydrate-binding protein [Echinicola strongylocentroti]|uniref:Carbohydrate-binding protein n=1 Tax=Echinicola strongylocentroti TaxID=1795355 RepID=A0A2Z4IQI3_9BACT|nr:glycoside hydrolase family 43 protein [Echinicola strongylocentroti]AWW32898.1 carbohydrate-binding protein [Echinicola strongylocentroti]
MKILHIQYIILGLILFQAGNSHAQNPIIQTSYTADPAPMVYNNKLYLYTSHDEDNSTWFTMNDWRLFTTEDMVNWTDHGAVLSYKEFSWGKMNAWAPQCIERDGKFYMYVPITDRDNKNGIGVAVADSPYGPFIDPLGKPLISNSMADIDPTVFVDDGGQAYLIWGNPVCYYVKLHEDMISLDGEIGQFPNTIEAFGKREGKEDPRRPTTYEEGPWLYKRNDLYYLLFAAGPLPEHIGYSTSEHPTGPWEYQGVLMPTEGESFTNHPGMVDFKGKTYLFYHNGALPGGSGFTRSVCVDEVKFNEDGTIVPMKMTAGITKSLGTINPYIKNEAETIAWSEGVSAANNKRVGNFIKADDSGTYSVVKGVDFRENGPHTINVRAGTTHNGNVSIEVRLDRLEGKLIAELPVPLTGGSDRWALINEAVKEVSGVHDLYFVYKGNAPRDILYFDYWMFSELTNK